MRLANAPAASLLLLILAVSSFSQTPAPPAATVPVTITSDALLQRAHATLPALTPFDRLDLLRMLVNTNKKHPEVYTVWLDEALAAASQTSNRFTRIDAQSWLINALSLVDSQSAFDKLAMLEPPQHRGDQDPRAVVTNWVFGRFYADHPTQLEKIITSARHIGDTAIYPFDGVSIVLSKIAERNANLKAAGEELEAADILMQDAVSYFRETPTSIPANEDFARLLQNNTRFIRPELLKPVLQELVTRLSQPPPVTGDRMFTIFVDKEEDTPAIVSRNRNDVLLAQLMPLIRSVDPAWEQKLRQSAEVNRITEWMANNSGLGIIGAYSNGKPGSDERTLQRLQMDRMNMLANARSDQAVKMLEEIKDPATHAATAARIAINMNESHLQESAQLLARAQLALKTIKKPDDRMNILLELARALAAMQRTEQLRDVVNQSFAEANDIVSAFIAQHPDAPSVGRVAPWQLSGIAELSAKRIPEHLLAMINDVRVPSLQASLLIAMAHGLDADDYPVRPQVPRKAAPPAR